MDASLILSRLPINGATAVGGNSAFKDFLPVLGDNGTLHSSLFTSTTDYLTLTDLTVTGVLTAQGSLATLDTDSVVFKTNSLLLNHLVTGVPSLNAGIQVKRGGATNASLLWNETNDCWSIGLLGSEDVIVTANNSITLAHKTLTTPTIAAILNSGTLTLPTSTDTLVGRGTTDTLTNKTLTAPVLTTPTLGVATATTVNKVAITAPATAATLTIANGKTLTANNTLTLAGTDASTLNIGAGGTLAASAYTDTTSASNISTGTLTTAVNAVGKAVSVTDDQFSIKDHSGHSAIARFDASGITASAIRTYILPNFDGTLATIAGDETLTNKTFDTALNTFKFGGVAVAGVTGTGSLVFDHSPTLLTPNITSPVITGAVTGTGNLVKANTPTLVTPVLSSPTFAGTVNGSGNVVLTTSPTLITPVLGAATATSINGLHLTSSSGTLTIANSKTLICNNSLTLSGTDGSTLTIGGGGTLGTAAFTASSTYATSAQGVKADNVGVVNGIIKSNGAALFSAAATTGSGSVVLATSPTLASPVLITPTLGVASATSVSSAGNVAITTVGSGLTVKGGSNARVGQSTLASGTITVTNTSVTVNTRVLITRHGTAGTTLGYLNVITTPGVSFTIQSLSAPSTVQTADNSTVDWLLVEQT